MLRLITSRLPRKVIIVSWERFFWLTWRGGYRCASEKEKHKITYCLEIFFARHHHQTASKPGVSRCVASCSSISSVNDGPDHRIRLLPRYYLPIQFCLIFPRSPPLSLFALPSFFCYFMCSSPFFVSSLSRRPPPRRAKHNKIKYIPSYSLFHAQNTNL